MFAAVTADEYSDRGGMLLLVILAAIFIGFIIKIMKGPEQ